MADDDKDIVIYIDGANLHFSAKSLGIEIDYRRLYIWLSENFKTNQIYLFTGHLKSQSAWYSDIKSLGYKLVFKKTLESKGKIKGNCDAELVLAASIDILRYNTKKIVLVSSDGDFACLLRFAKDEGVETSVVSPSNKLSFLIRMLNLRVTYLQDIKTLVKLRSEKAPGAH